MKNRQKSFDLQLVLYDETTKVDGYSIPAICTNVSTDDDQNITIGRVESNKTISGVESNRRRTVTGGHYLGIYFNIGCGDTKSNNKKDNLCTFITFMPAVDLNVMRQFILVKDDIKPLPDLDTLSTMEKVGLQFSFTIEGGETLCMHHSITNIMCCNTEKCEQESIPSEVIVVVLLAIFGFIILLLVIVLSLLLLHKSYTIKKKKGRNCISCYSSVSQENEVVNTICQNGSCFTVSSMAGCGT